jgi:hypothetical protein
MSDWIHALPVGWMATLIFGVTFLVTAAIHWLVQSLARGDRARTFKAVSPGLLPPLGIIFGLFVAFLSVQAWGDLERAHTAVDREAGALRAVVILSDSFPSEAARLRGLIRQHIQEAQTDEWPAMAHRRATITIIPAALAQAMQTTLTLPVQGEGQAAAQRAIVASLEDALAARRQRILLSEAEVNGVKWMCLMLQAICTLTAIALVHADNGRSSAIAMGLFSTAIAVCILLITAHDRPFTGQNAVPPTVLLQVQPDASDASPGASPGR